MSKDIVVIPEQNQIATIIEKAVTSGADFSVIEKFLDLQERYEERQAEKAYHKAMSQFKANPPEIVKDRQVGYGNTNYKHASLFNVTTSINQELSKYGLSASFKTEQLENGGIKVICCITHELGHKECTSLVSPPDNSGKKNSIQAIGSTVTYLQRYTLLALTGLATKEQDDDAASAEPKPTITPEQEADLYALMEEVKAKPEQFFKYLAVNNLSELHVDRYQFAVNALEAKRKK